jgi:O-antigen ligase
MRLIAFLVAIGGGFLLNTELPPMVQHPNQILAVFGWGVVLCLMPAPALGRATLRSALPVLAALLLVTLACATAFATGLYPKSPTIPTLALLAMAMLLVLHGAGWGAIDDGRAFRSFALALVLTCIASALIAIVQFVDPDRPDSFFIARSTYPGRSTGNIAQPNHLADALLWGLAALVPLVEWRRHSRASVVALLLVGVLLLEGAVLSGSRTGFVAIGLLAAWGLIDRALPRAARLALMASPLVTLLLWLVTQAVASMAHLTLDIARSNVGDLTSFRGEIWHNALAIIAGQPWTGVGWGQFNFVWTLTPIAFRPAGFVDNAHNLVLQLAAELGIPLAALILGLLVFAAWKGVAGIRRVPGPAGIGARSAAAMVVIVGLHSMLEFPLWYAYFLLPAAWAWGYAMGVAGRAAAPAQAASAAIADRGEAPATSLEPVRLWRVLGLLMVAAGASAWFDYRNITAIYVPGHDAPPLAERVARGEASPLFSRHAEYTHAIVMRPASAAWPEIQRSSHVLLDARLMFALASALEQRGEIEKARYVTDRMREFHRKDTDAFFAPCNDPAITPKPFQCTPASGHLTWHDFE